MIRIYYLLFVCFRVIYVLPKKKEVQTIKIIYSLKERKPFVQALEEITGTKSVYKKSPTFAYEVGCLTINKDGDLEFDDHVDVDSMKEILNELEKRGFVAKDNPYKRMQENPLEEKEGSEEIVPEEDEQEAALEPKEMGLQFPCQGNTLMTRHLRTSKIWWSRNRL